MGVEESGSGRGWGWWKVEVVEGGGGRGWGWMDETGRCRVANDFERLEWVM